MTLPKISIIVPTYLPSNQKYLDICLRSIENLDYPKDRLDVVVVSSNAFEPIVSEGLKKVSVKERLHFASAVNLGVANADVDADFYFLVSDDVILTKDSLREFIESVGSSQGVFGPISNCDTASMHSLAMGFTNHAGFNFVADRQYRYQDLEPVFDELIDAKSVYPRGLIFYPWLCFYAVLIPKKVWTELKGLDENFKSGKEDLDFCRRASALGYRCAVSLSSLIWHFGGVTADQVLTSDVRLENEKYYAEKWKA